MPISLLALAIGLAMLVVGGELLVRGASRLALLARLSPLFVGLTVVAYGTSSPELVVSISSTLRGSGSMSLGNVVGSNIFNVLFILGCAALVYPLQVKEQIVRWDLPLMIGVSLLFAALALDGRFSAVEGAVLLAGLALYTLRTYFLARQTPEPIEPDASRPAVTGARDWLGSATFMLLGLAILVGGCELFLRGAVAMAESLGVSRRVIGLTILAAGTSLPELVTSIVASYRNERDIAVGNVVGSNLFNLLGVQGTASIVSWTGIVVPPALLTLDIPVLLLTAFVCWPFFVSGRVVSRREGAVLVTAYVIYTTYLVLQASADVEVAP